MPGGLLQIASSGVQDIYLTKNPEITFFKKVYRRHTNFSMQTNEITIEQVPNFGNDFFINIPPNGDLLHRCFFEVTIPKLNIDDSSITNTEFSSIKSSNLKTIETEKNKWKREYDELTRFSNIQINFYRSLNILLRSQDVTFQSILNKTLIEKNTYSLDFENIIFTLEEDLISRLNIIDYIINLNKTFGALDTALTITYSSFVTNIKTLYNNNIKQLKYYHSNFVYNKNKYDVLNSGKIKYAWINNLGHHFFNNFETEIDGRVIESYTNDYFNIYQSHHLKDDQKSNYNELIGNNEKLNSFEGEKSSYKIYIPLIFWFNRSSSFSLPLISMSNSNVKINVRINELKNLIYFEDYNYEYNNLLKYELSFNDHVKNSHKLTIENIDSTNSNVSDVDIEKVTLLASEKLYIYHFKYITKELLKLKFNSLTDNQINKLFTSYSDDNSKMKLKDWINFRLNSPNDSDADIQQISKYLNYYQHPSFVDYNIFTNKVGYPQVKFFAEYIYLDEVERYKFAKHNLEYVINIPNQITTDIKNSTLFSSDVNLLKPTRDLIWFIRPNTAVNGLTNYSYKNPNLYNQKLYKTEDKLTDLSGKIFDNFVLMVQDSELINFKYGENYYIFATKYGKLNYIEDKDSIYYYFPLSLFPENDQPSGNVNFSVIKGKSIQIKLNENFLKEYYDTKININSQNLQLIIINRTFNLLKFSKGKGGSVFY